MEITTKPFFSVLFFSFFLFTYLTVFIDDTSFDHGVEVYYLKGVIELPIVISFHDR